MVSLIRTANNSHLNNYYITPHNSNQPWCAAGKHPLSTTLSHGHQPLEQIIKVLNKIWINYNHWQLHLTHKSGSKRIFTWHNQISAKALNCVTTLRITRMIDTSTEQSQKQDGFMSKYCLTSVM